MHVITRKKKLLMFLIVIIVLLGTVSTTFAADDAQLETAATAVPFELRQTIPGFDTEGGFDWLEWDGFPGISNIIRPIQPWGIDAQYDPPVLPLY